MDPERVGEISCAHGFCFVWLDGILLFVSVVNHGSVNETDNLC